MDNIFTVTKPFLSILTIFGVFPFSFQGVALKGNLVFKFKNVIPMGITLCMVCYFTVASFLAKEFSFNSNILSKALKALTIADLVFVFILHIYQFSKRSEMNLFLLTIHNYDNQASYYAHRFYIRISIKKSLSDDFNKDLSGLALSKKMANCNSCFCWLIFSRYASNLPDL